MRGTTRDQARRGEIEATGAEALVGDPDGSRRSARSLERERSLCGLLGSAVGPPEQLAALHGTRLEMLLTRMLDTTVRGIVYEAAGTVDRALLGAGAARCARVRGLRIPYALLAADPADDDAWRRGGGRGQPRARGALGGPTLDSKTNR